VQDYIFRDDLAGRNQDITDTWSTTGTFSLDSEVDLEVIEPGEMIYAGTSLSEIRKKFESESANFAIVLRCFGREDLKFEIRGRRDDENNFIALKLDFSADTVEIYRRKAGIDKTLALVSHNLKFDGIRYYSVELWMYESKLFAFVNGAMLMEARSSDFIDAMGFSLYVPSLNESDPARFNVIVVHDLIKQIEQPETDPSDLIIEFRKKMQEEINNPVNRNWETFIRARKLWYYHRDIRHINEIWGDQGFPLRQPRSEDWF
jgi:hypothetical protein